MVQWVVHSMSTRLFRRRSGHYYFRWVVPSSLMQRWSSAGEVKLSLRTTKRRHALALSASIWNKCVQLQDNPVSLNGHKLQIYLRENLDNYSEHAKLVSNNGDKRNMQLTKQRSNNFNLPVQKSPLTPCPRLYPLMEAVGSISNDALRASAFFTSV